MKKGIFIWIFVAALLAIGLTQWMRWRAGLREANLQAEFQRQKCLMAELLDRRHQLLESATNRTTQDKQVKEKLLQLRGEVSQLRREVVDREKLKKNIEALKEEVAQARKLPSSETPPDPSTVRAYWPKERLAYSGHANQISAIQSALWAMNRGDVHALEATFTTNAIQDFSGVNPPNDELMRQTKLIHLANGLQPAKGFYVVSDDIVPRLKDFTVPGLQIFKVYFEGEGATRGIGVMKTGEEWKFVGIYSIGATDEEPEYFSNLWP